MSQANPDTSAFPIPTHCRSYMRSLACLTQTPVNTAATLGMTQNHPVFHCRSSRDSLTRRLGRIGTLMLAGLGGPWVGLTAAAEPLTRIAEVRQLPRAEADKALPVRVRGVVTWCLDHENLTIQDDSAGIWVGIAQARKHQLWRGDDGVLGQIREGMEVEIEGQSIAGGYAPLILPVTLRILGTKPLPQPRPIQQGRFFSGSDDCQRVEVRGVVQGFYYWKRELTLIMDANPGHFTAQFPSAMVPDPAALVDAELRLRGVATTRFNTRAEATGSRVKVSVPGDWVVEKPPPPPDAVPWVTLDQLLPFRTEPFGPHRVRVVGTVTYSLPGAFFYLQDGDSAVRVETTSTTVLQPGDRVEVVGFVDISRLIGTLRDATVRKTGVAGLLGPERISPVEIRQIYESSVNTGQLQMLRDYDGHVIRCRARLLAVESASDDKGSQTLTLEQSRTSGQGPHVFRAALYGGKAQALDRLQLGSELEVTGLVQLEFATNELNAYSAKTVPINLDLILRSAADVVVLQQPSWWSARHFLAVLTVVVLALGGALVWNLQLKRQVRRKTMLLGREKNARRDAAIEFRSTMRERNRLAANLHDTLPQSMSGIGLQLDACEISLRRLGIDDLPPLEVARRMVEYAINELRGAVWEMRSLSLRGRSFTAALQAVVDQVSRGHSARITVATEGPLERIPDFVSGNLLLIVQEALRNAQQHANPAHISVLIRTESQGALIRLELLDDGCGFVLDALRGPEQGHYGIVGMRERAERLGGSLRVISTPGHGTRIFAEVSQHVDDAEMADEELLADPPIAATLDRA